jgi:hypothetical protein
MLDGHYTIKIDSSENSNEQCTRLKRLILLSTKASDNDE